MPRSEPDSPQADSSRFRLPMRRSRRRSSRSARRSARFRAGELRLVLLLSLAAQKEREVALELAGVVGRAPPQKRSALAEQRTELRFDHVERLLGAAGDEDRLSPGQVFERERRDGVRLSRAGRSHDERERMAPRRVQHEALSATQDGGDRGGSRTRARARRADRRERLREEPRAGRSRRAARARRERPSSSAGSRREPSPPRERRRDRESSESRRTSRSARREGKW